MKRLLVAPWGLALVGLFALSVLAHDLRLWWGWRREDRIDARGCPDKRRAGGAAKKGGPGVCPMGETPGA